MLPNFFMGPTLYDSRLPLINQAREGGSNPAEPGVVNACGLARALLLLRRRPSRT